MVINSVANSKIKFLKSLYEKKKRAELMLFVAEGINTLKELSSELIKEIFVSETAYPKIEQEIESKIVNNSDITLNIISDMIFDKISDTINPAGVVTICRIKEPQNIGSGDIGVLDRIRDPGNLGTILRSSEALGIRDLILVDCAEPYNPKVVRSSLGAIMSLNIIQCKDSLSALKVINGINIYSLSMQGKSIYDFKRKGRLALVLGNEAQGVSREFIDASDGCLSIPMAGKMDSLNAAVSYAIAVSYIENIKHSDFFDQLI